MPSIELKTLDRLNNNDILLVDADQLIKAGKGFSEAMVKRLGQHKLAFVPTLSFTYEEMEKLTLNHSKEEIEKLRLKEVELRRTKITDLKYRMVEKLKSLYVPFDEQNNCFRAKGKKKQITMDLLLEGEPGPLYQPDIDAGSESIIPNTDVRYLVEIIKTLFSHFDSLNYLGSDTYQQARRISRLKLTSMKMHSIYENSRLSGVGNVFPSHAADCAIYFLVALCNLNKKRAIQGCPLSTDRFDPDKGYTKGTLYQYRAGMIMDATMGVLLHAIGFSHNTIHSVISTLPILSEESQETIKKRRIIQRNNYVARNILRNRKDVSSLAKMITSLQYEYPDGTGFPPLNENRGLHEFVRLFQVIDAYDELTNPNISTNVYSRMDVINYLLKNQGEYEHTFGTFTKCPRFDSRMVYAFLQILAPWEIGEKVYLFPVDQRDTPYFVGRVYSYLDTYIPLISILQDKRNGKNYRFGTLLFYIPQAMAFNMENGKIVKKTKLDWINKLTIVDIKQNPCSIDDYKDYIFGAERKLSKSVKRGK